MEDQQNSALLERAPSSDSFTPPRSNANTKALKVAGLTVLACLLLAGQALTAYFVLGQRDHITALEQGQENLKVQLMRRPSGGAKQMHVPMNSLPLMTSLSDEDVPKQKTPLTKLQSTSFQREGSGIWDGPRMPSKRMFRPMDSLPLLTDITEEKVEEPKGTESAASEVESKCQLDAEREVMPGNYRPQCDEEGNYLPTQCWHSTGYCWCVDKDGNMIPGTKSRGRIHCGDVNAESA